LIEIILLYILRRVYRYIFQEKAKGKHNKSIIMGKIRKVLLEKACRHVKNVLYNTVIW